MRIFIKNIFFILAVFSALSYTAAAQSRIPQPKEVLSSIQKALQGLGTADFEFSFQAFGQDGTVLGDENGHFVGQGDAFRLSTDVMTVFCDGHTKWIYNTVNEEVTIFPHDVSSVDPAENPFAVLSKADASAYSFKGGTDADKAEAGALVYTVNMVPKDKEQSFTSLRITVNADTFLPRAVIYNSRTGDRYELVIVSAASVEAKPGEFFRPSQELMDNPEIYITDMR
ncbi:MAG TPA: outer membrane lipoprotein carrier protein LolA [Candidatus Coprenecus stercoravium]|uniref:Outer membrane lipoprotein carrier protein LolA n=1 Tax=Candidatus Coprenecus stercoravium TaxID=2840735 RepID=A0A9D2K9I0_9BACT|nr:outer membrane lipoprotein carrier protein LolA [Candidatus Coprenecus stercoravium]